MEKFDEEFDEFENEGESRAGKFLPVIVVIVALLAVGGLGWYAFHSADQETDMAGVPTIKADDGTIREKPAEEGGMEIPHQDREIYDTVTTTQGKPAAPATVKNTAEEPISRDKIAEKSKAAAAKAAEKKAERLLDDEEAAPVPAAKTAETKAVESVEAAERPVAPVQSSGHVESSATAETQASQPVATPAPLAAEKKAAAEADPVAAFKPATPPPGVRIQLGAFRSEAEAVESWKKILGKNKDVLANKVFTVRKADLGEKGIYYRLQVGSFPSPDDAKKACKALNERKLGCFVAR